MKKYICFLFVVITNSCFTNAQPSIQWQKCLGGTNSDGASSIQLTADKGYIIAGSSNSNDNDVTGNHGNSDFWIVKLDSTGAIQLQKSFGGSNIDNAFSIHQTTDSGYIVAGVTKSNDGDISGYHGSFDSWIVKLDSSFNIQWQKSLGGSSEDWALSIQQTTDGGYIFAGESMSSDGDVTGHIGTNNFSTDYWIVKLDNTGIIQWQKSLGGTQSDAARSIQQTNDGGYIVAGESFSNDSDVTGNHGNVDYWIVKLDSIGTIQWQKSLGGTNEDRASSIQQTADGGYIVAGQSYSSDGDVTVNHGMYDYWIVKLDNIGNLQWQKSFGDSGEDGPYFIQQTIEGGYIVAGTALTNNGNGFFDSWIVKLDNNGNMQWEKFLGGMDRDGSSSIQQTTDGGFIVGGVTISNDGDVTGNHGDNDFWIVKLSSLVSVNELQNSILDFRIAPNPFSSITILSFKLSSFRNISIEIHDLEGRIIKKLNSKNLSSGLNELFWDATNNSGCKVDSGIYYITIVSDNKIETKKVVLLRN